MDNRIREALESLRIAHIECDDGWYSCPKCDDGCLNPSEGAECNCGADEHNRRVDELIAILDAPVASDARELVSNIREDCPAWNGEYVEHSWEIDSDTAANLIESFAADRERKAREETARKCAEAVRNAIFDFGIGRGASNTYSPIMRRDMAVQLAERSIMEAAHE